MNSAEFALEVSSWFHVEARSVELPSSTTRTHYSEIDQRSEQCQTLKLEEYNVRFILENISFISCDTDLSERE